MGNKGIDCPKCKYHISGDKIKFQLKEDIEPFQKKKEKLEKKEKELENKEKELESLKKQLEKEKNYIENDLKKKESNWEKQFKIDIKNKNATDYYDVIICIDSIIGIESGWKVKSTEKGKKLYEEMKDKELVKVGVVGLRNKGKSWLLQKFLKKHYQKEQVLKQKV
jgi:predicted RNase H-like nuclease (RuvC/YqgF family)